MIESGDRVAAVTGANGLVGSVACDALSGEGFAIRRLIRRPETGSDDRPFSLSGGCRVDDLRGADLLVHCAWDLAATSPTEVWSTNVLGTRRLLQTAVDAGVRRTVVVSSMSAYAGTRQLYGRAKLATELDAFSHGMAAVRLGLVYGSRWGGMAGALRRLAALPVVPLLARHAHQFTVHEDDLARALGILARAPTVPCRPLGLAHHEPVNFDRLMRELARASGADPSFVPLPWRPVYAAMRLAELLRIPLPLRADSLWGLAHPAGEVPGQGDLRSLGIDFRPFAPGGRQ